MEALEAELSSIETLLPELPTWALGSKSARPGVPPDQEYEPERLIVAGNWIRGEGRFVTCLGKDRRAVCRIRDARLCQVWVVGGSRVFRSREEAAGAASDGEGVFACTSWRDGSVVNLGSYLREASIGSLVTRLLLRPGICPFFVELVGSSRTYKSCMTVLELCDTSFAHLASCLDDDEILSVIRQVTTGLVVGEEAAGLRFCRSTGLTSLLLTDAETSNISWSGEKISEDTFFCVTVRGRRYRFASHGILAKLSGYSSAEIRLGDVRLERVDRPLHPRDVVRKILCHPGATRKVSAETKTFLSGLCRTKSTGEFCDRLFSSCEEGSRRGDVAVGTLALLDRSDGALARAVRQRPVDAGRGTGRDDRAP